MRSGSIYTPLGSTVCVLRSICYKKVNEVNHQRVDAGFSANAHDRRAISRGLAPCTMRGVCWGIEGPPERAQGHLGDCLEKLMGVNGSKCFKIAQKNLPKSTVTSVFDILFWKLH